jgi:hypothetical protein
VVLGVEVFLRPAARFDPRQDSIVRVEARRLRQKLARWYADEGANARLEFVLTAGRYDVELRRREPSARPRGSVAVFELPPSPALNAALQASLGAELAAVLARLNGLRVVRGGALPSGGDVRHAAACPGAGCRSSMPCWARSTRSARTRAAVARAALRQRPGAVVAPRAAGVRRRRAGCWRPWRPWRAASSRPCTATPRSASCSGCALAGSQPLLRALAHGGPYRRGAGPLGLARIALRRTDVDGCRKAVQLCDEAVALMPGHAPAFALLAEALIATSA